MFKWVVASMFLVSGMAYGNPGVKKGTDVSKRKSKEHYQVTRCVEGKCQVFEVTEFDKALEMQGDYSAECFFIVEGTKRFMACSKEPKKSKVVVVKSEPVVVEKVVEKKVAVPYYIQPKKNRFSLHAGFGPGGLTEESDLDKTVVSEKKGVVLGLGYQRLLGKSVSLGASGYTNKSVVFSLGFDF